MLIVLITINFISLSFGNSLPFEVKVTPKSSKKFARIIREPNEINDSSKKVDDLIGSHQGKLRSAGSFQTELSLRTVGVEVYLVDELGRFPIIKKSELSGQIYFGDQEAELNFKVFAHHRKFFATWPPEFQKFMKNKKSQKYSIVLLPTRKSTIGTPVLYQLNTIDKP